MKSMKGKSLLIGLAAGASVTAFGALMMGQGVTQPEGRSDQYFVTGEGNTAHLWARDGSTLRWVGKGEVRHDMKDRDVPGNPKPREPVPNPSNPSNPPK